MNLETAIQFLNDDVRPNAQVIDTNVGAMRAVFQKMRDKCILSLRRPEEFGGPGIPEGEFRSFQEEVARASGSLAFLQTQHQSAVSLLAKQGRDHVKAEYLPRMHGPKTVGIGFSQLRRTGEPICKAEQTEDGYILNGQVPWITGFTFFDEYLVGAALPSGEAVFGFMPFKAVDGQSLTEPMKLAAMETAQTVTANLDNYVLREDRVAFVKDAGWIRANDAFNIVLQGHFAIGCALAGADVVKDNADKKNLSFLQDAAAKLYQEIDDCRAALVASQRDFDETTAPDRLKKRAWAIDVMMRCAQSAVVSSSGAANYATHPAQRILREAIVFSVSAQTVPIMEATLERLVRTPL